ncbi:hypothetical protein HPB49_013460 [Dermacentor silvarum]|uniref:Uncharacterized protein n=1 Tax=Dermacentor silvarum TaxID=543639 RepID=A0ACB8E0H9_DERSI|nr:hypothetical protein HPB49_013460 [Dermacentor silvarum]
MKFEEFDACSRVTAPDAPKDQHIRVVEPLVRSWDINFSVRKDEKQAAIFSSLTGNVEVLLVKLPGNLHGKLHRDTEADVIKLYNVAQDVFEHFACDTSGTPIEDKTRLFLEIFASLGSIQGTGYGPRRVMRYINFFAHHASAKHARFQNLGSF